MAATLAHRGPDGQGVWNNPSGCVGLGHRRLAIIDLSEGGSQPMHYAGGLTITYNGEIYNYIEIRESLQRLGYSFESTSDTEVILAAYKHYGVDCLQHFDGMFALAIWDENTSELFLARDRFGEKPLYFVPWDREFLFASEMKALFGIGVGKRVSSGMVYNYLMYDVVENPADKTATFYQEVSQLPAAHYLRVSSDNRITMHRYWDIDYSRKCGDSSEDAAERFIELFDRSVRARLRSDVPVGTSLSGGVDSSSVVASIINVKGEGGVQTFTARFPGTDYDEGHFLELLGRRYQFQSNCCYPKVEQIAEELDKIFYHQEEPFGSTSTTAQWEVMRLAQRCGVTVLLDGQGADESLAGYYKYFTPYLMETYWKDRRNYPAKVQAIRDCLGEDYELGLRRKLFALIPQLFRLAARLTGGLRRTRLARNMGVSHQLASECAELASPFQHFRSLDEALYFDLFSYGLGKLLRYADRNSMAFSREVRLPFLSHELVEYVFSLSNDLRIQGGWSKYILRNSMTPKLPSEIAWRKDKKGYQAPASWMEHPKMKGLTEDAYRLLLREGYVDSFVEENSWKYIMLQKVLTY